MKLLIPPPLVAALIAAAMWLIARKVDVATLSSAMLTSLALALLTAGVLLMGAAVLPFMQAKTTINPMRPARASHLITTGVFSHSRNPIYLADLLLLAAFAVWLGNGLNVTLLAVFVWYINRFQIAPEERALTTLFGQDYFTYCATVRRWL